MDVSPEATNELDIEGATPSHELARSTDVLAVNGGRVRRIGLLGLVARFRRDRSGTTAVQAILLMPVVLFFFAAAVVTWQTINIRKSLNDGVYRAVRYLSLYPPPNIDSSYWQDIAREFIEAELLSNPWTKRPISDVDLRITITIPDSNECGDEFTLEAGYRLFAPVGQLDRGAAMAILPNNVLIELEEMRNGLVICD